MSFVGISAGTATSIAAGVGAAGSLASGIMGAAGAGSGADAAAQVAAAQLAYQQKIYDEAKANLQPYMNFGQTNIPNYQTAVNQYMGAVPSMTTPYSASQYAQSPLYTPMVTNLAELQATPGYQMQLQQGLQAINNSAAAKGGLLSGANQMALNNYAQNQAATGFQSAWDRAQSAYQNAFNQNLSTQQQMANVYGQQANVTGGAAGVGQSAAAQLAGVGVGQGNAINNAYQNLGNAQAAQAMAGAPAWNQAIKGMTSGIGSFLGSGSGSGNSLFSGIASGRPMGNVVSPLSMNTLMSEFGNAPASF